MMNKHPEISVIMPVYNESIHDLQESINSIINQTYRDFEFIIIDDNPLSENIKTFLLNISNVDDRIKLIFNRHNLKLIKTENKAIRLSNGRYIARMDADDIAVKNRLYKQLSFLRYNHLDIVCSNFSTINDDGILTRKYSFSKKSQANQTKIKNVMSHCNIVIGPTLFFSRQVFNGINGYRQTCVDDYDFAARSLIMGYKLGYQAKSLIKKRLRKNSISYSRLLPQYVVIRTIGKWLYKFKFSELMPLSVLTNSVNSISKKQLKHFSKYANARYSYNNKKNLFNLIRVIYSILISKTVFCRCLWSLFVNKRQERYM